MKKEELSKSNKDVLRVFISYARENEEAIQTIVSFANYLRKFGIDPYLDEIENDIHPSVNFKEYMEKAPLISDKVIIVLSKTYKNRADNNYGGVGEECAVFEEDYKKTPDKYIFVGICDGNRTINANEITPKIFQGVSVHVLNSNQESFDDLIRRIYDIPKFKLSELGEKLNFKQEEIPSFFNLIQDKRYKNYDFSNILFHTILTIDENDEDFSYEAYRCILVCSLKMADFKMCPQFDDRSNAKLSSKLVALPENVQMDEENRIIFTYPLPKDNKMGDIIPMHYRLDLKSPKSKLREWAMHSENDSYIEIHDIVTKYQDKAPDAKLYKRGLYSIHESFERNVQFNEETKSYRLILQNPETEYTYILRW